MKVFSQLVSAQAENKASDYSAGTMGRFWINSATGLFKYDDGSAIRAVVSLDGTQTLTNKTWNGVPISEAYGGTNQTTYTTGDILYASGANTLSKLAKGSAGTFLKQGASIPSWSSVTASLGVVTKTTTYTITSSDDLILADASGAGFTLTLPSASGSGKAYYIKKTDSDFTKAVTIARAGSDTIQDVATGLTSTTLNTQGEEILIVDTASGAWQIVNRRIPVVGASYTPTGASSTNTTYSGYWRRVGDLMVLQGKISFSGVPDNVVMTITLPSGVTIDTSKWPFGTSNCGIGSGIVRASGAPYGCSPIYSSTTAIEFTAISASSASNHDLVSVTRSVPNTAGNNDYIGFTATIPISGWNG